MTTLTAKQRAIRDREARILELSRKMVVQSGYHGLNMDRIAESLDVSKGTLYNHFACKEEIIIALAIQTSEKRWQMFRQAAQFVGRPRERMLAIAYASDTFSEEEKEHSKFEQILRIASIWEKTSEKRRLVMQTCESRCMGIVSGIVRDAIAAGDLVLQNDMTPEELVFGLWAISEGTDWIAESSYSLRDLGIGDPKRVKNQHITTLLDGYGWRPLSSEQDYRQIFQRIEREVL